jgi:predicted neuraminidase
MKFKLNIYYLIYMMTCAFISMLFGRSQMKNQEFKIENQPGYLKGEFIFDSAPFPECHASTIEESGGILIAAWFGGTEEKNKDVGIWISRLVNGRWTIPLEVVNGIQHSKKRYPCWNPVLFQPVEGRLMLFYKVGPDPRNWWGELVSSGDFGSSWDLPRRLPEDILGPVKNKPIQLENGTLLCGSSTEHNGWIIQMEISPDLGNTWELITPLNDSKKLNAIQPTILTYGGNKMQILCRSKEGFITECWSYDGGKNWDDMKNTTLPNPNSGIDGVTLKDGRQILVYNHTTTLQGQWGGPRSPLNVAVSDDGKKWKAALILENEAGEYSYPAIIQTQDGLVHTTYTWKRKKVKHVVIDPAKLELSEFQNGQWPQ